MYLLPLLLLIHRGEGSFEDEHRLLTRDNIARIGQILAGVILAHPRLLQVVRTKNKRRWDPALSSQLTTNTSMMKTLVLSIVLASLSSLIQGQVNLDFSTATINPETGALCMMQEVCIGNLEALQSRLPQTPCLDEKCNCASDADCGGGTSK